MSRFRGIGVVAATALIAMTMAACGSSDSSGDSSPAASSGPKPTGTPLKVMSVVVDSPKTGFRIPEEFEGVQAAVKYINDNGGINGHPVKAEQCLTDYSVDQSTACVNKAIKDPAYVALVGSIFTEGAATNPLLEKAKLPNIGAFALTPVDYSSPSFFPVGIGALESTAAASILFNDLGLKKIGAYSVKTAGSDTAIAAIDGLLKGKGLKLEQNVVVDAGKQDITAEVSKALDGTDGVIMSVEPLTTAKFLKTQITLGSKTPIAFPSLVAPPAVLKTVGGSLDNVYVATSFMPPGTDGEGVKTFEKQMKDFGVKGVPAEFHQYGWSALQLLVAAAGSDKTITRESLWNNLNKLSSFEIKGFSAPEDFTKPQTVLGGTVPRMFNGTISANRANADGTVTPLTGKLTEAFQ
ncbi:MAG: ABC transporter substrate-binding protein [Aeromicrobium sp.]